MGSTSPGFEPSSPVRVPPLGSDSAAFPVARSTSGDLIWGVKDLPSPITQQPKTIGALIHDKLNQPNAIGKSTTATIDQMLREEEQLKAQRDTMLGPEVNDEELETKQHSPIAEDRTAIDKAVAQLLPIMQALVNEKVKVSVNTSALADEVMAKTLAKLALTNQLVQTIEIKHLDTGEILKLGAQHKQFPILLKCVEARVNVWLAGPSGSGKTTAAMQVAKALNLPYYYTGAVNDQYALLGYKNASGDYVRTMLREAWEHGGVFLWDEVDASDPNALVAFNALLANEIGAFADACVPRHPDCIMIAAANTWGHGATHEYVGRLKMDMAFLKRFAFISWEYDEQLEWNTAPNRVWTKRVQEIRRRVMAKGLRVLVTPRESYIGAKLLAAGIEQPIVEQMTIQSGMTPDQWAQVR